MLKEILRLDKLISDCLAETFKLKSAVVGLQQYEYAARIRNLEKQFETIRSEVTTLPYPIIPNKGLTRNGPIYSGQLFSYGHAMGWKNLPDHINRLFITRRTELNNIMVHSDATTAFLLSLNSKLANEESRINAFINALF